MWPHMLISIISDIYLFVLLKFYSFWFSFFPYGEQRLLSNFMWLLYFLLSKAEKQQNYWLGQGYIFEKNQWAFPIVIQHLNSFFFFFNNIWTLLDGNIGDQNPTEYLLNTSLKLKGKKKEENEKQIKICWDIL